MDAMSQWYRQSPAGEAARARENRDEREYAAYLEAVRQAAEKINLNEDEITPQAVGATYLNMDKLSSNIREAAPQAQYSIFDYQGSGRGHATHFELRENALKLRLHNYFMKEVEDFSVDNKLDAAVAFAKSGRMKSLEFVSESLYLKAEEAAAVMQAFPDEDFKSMEILLRFPSVFNGEETEEIIKTKWLKQLKSKIDHPDGLKGMPGAGESKEDREFHSLLQSIYEQNTGKSFENLQDDGQGFFDILYQSSSFEYQNNLLITDYKEQFLQKVLDDKKFGKVLPYLELQENGKLADQETNRELSEFLDGNWKISADDKGSNPKLRAYLYHRMQAGIFDEDALKLVLSSPSKTEGEFPLFEEALYTGEIKDPQVEQMVLEGFWQESARLNGSFIKKRYQELTGKNIENLVNDKGQSRFEWLLNNSRKIDPGIMLANVMHDFPEETFNLPLENAKKLPFDRWSKLSFNAELEPQNLEQAEFMSRAVEKFGSEILTDPKFGRISQFSTDVLAYRYKKGIIKPEEKEALRKASTTHFDQLEQLANQRGESFYSIEQLSDLILEKKDKSIKALLSNGMAFDSSKQKYKVFNDLLENAFKSDKKAEFYPYIDRMLNESKLQLTRLSFFLDKNEQCSSSVFLDFALHYFGKNPAVDKSVLEFAAREAQKNDGIYSRHQDALAKCGLNIKANNAFSLIYYLNNRQAKFTIPEKPQDYDFNVLALNAPDYHPSYRSKTTFLNEACIYRNGEAAAMALNQGADPFLKIEFAMGKNSGLPFAGLFRREMKNGLDNVQKFMGEVAMHLEEGKGNVLENVWRSLGRDLREMPQVKAVIDATNKVYKNRDFKAEKEAVLKVQKEAEELQRQEQIKREERARQEEERRARLKRENDLYDLREKFIQSTSEELLGLNDVKVAEKIATYLQVNKEELPVIPNKEELDQINEGVKAWRNEKRRIQAKNNAKEIESMNDRISSFIFRSSGFGERIADPEQVKQFIAENFADSKFAEGFAEGETAYIQQRQAEAAKKIKLLKQFEEVAEKEMNNFFMKDAGSFGSSYFSAVGKDRRANGMNLITERALKKMGLGEVAKARDDMSMPLNQDYTHYYMHVKKLIERQKEETINLQEKETAVLQELLINKKETPLSPEAEVQDGGSSSREEIKAAKAKTKQADKGEQAAIDLSALAGMWGAKVKSSKR